MKGGWRRSDGRVVVGRLSRGMRAEHLPVKALARRPEAMNGARVAMERPDRSPKDCKRRSSRRHAKALIGWIGHVRGSRPWARRDAPGQRFQRIR